MKKLLNVVILVLCVVAISDASGTHRKADIDWSGMGKIDASYPYQTTSLYGPVSDADDTNPVNCTINVEVTLNDGTIVTGEITIMDVSWWNCTKLKVVNLLSKVF